MSDRNFQIKTLANPSAEVALLAATLRASPEQRVQWCVHVQDNWFTSADRITTAMVIRDLVNRSLPIDLTLLKDGLRAHLPDATLGPIADQLATALPSADLWRPLAERVQDYFVRRAGVAAADEAKQRFLDLATPSADALEEAEAAFFGLHARKQDKGMRHVSESLDDALKSIHESLNNKGYVTGGLPFGFTDLDRSYIKGMRPGHVVMYVAPPGGGKTVAMMKTAFNRATGTGDYDEYARAVAWAELKDESKRKHLNYLPSNTGVYTLEMDDVQLTERLLITNARVEMAKMHRGQMSRKEQDQIAQAHARIAKSRLFFDFVPGISIQELRQRARYDVMRHKLSLICIDYAQLITSNSKEAKRGNRTQEMVDVSKGLKLLAQECGVPLIVLAQPKQETWGMRAQLNAMAETAQLAKDADLVVMFGFWDKIAKQIEGLEKKTKGEVAGDEADHDDREPDDPRCYAYADIVKNRHGPNNNGKSPIKLLWERDYFDFISTNKRLFDSTGQETQEI